MTELVMRPLARIGIGLVCLAAMLPTLVNGQYFGQNKVRYETFDFQILDTEEFNIYYYPRERQAAVEAGRMAVRWSNRHSRVLDWSLSPRQPVILYDNPTAFQGTNVIPDYIGETTGGVTEGMRRRVVMPLAGPLRETDHVLGHELVHAFQYDIANRGGRGGAGMGGILNMPLWLIEGMAEYLSLGPDDPLTAMWMRDAVLRDEIPTIKQLDNPSKYFPYRYGHAFWAFVGGRYGDEKAGRILKAAGSRGSVEGALSTALGVSPDELSKQWAEALKAEYGPVLKATRKVEDSARTVIKGERDGFLNVAPVVSPDGTRLMLFSQRDMFSVDLYLVDAADGDFIRQVTKTAVDPHTLSIEFLNSAGAWSRDGRLFVHPTVTDGKPELAIYDVEAGNTNRRIPLGQFGQVLSPTFSPDSKQIAFTAMTGGLTDLWIVDVESGKTRQMTKDAFAELQPAWSPDGRQIAFATDRFTSNLDSLAMGQYRIGLLDVAGGNIHQAPSWNSGKAISPQWSPDGRSLYFISDRDGISNIYRAAMESGRISQLTNLQTGVSGITALSPALSVAATNGSIVFSAFSAGNYGIFSMGEKEDLAGTEPNNEVSRLNAGILPPRNRAEGLIASDLRRPSQGIPPGTGFRSRPYRASLGLDYVAPPSIGLGVSNYGTQVGGGTALYFSDMLGNHSLMTAIESASFTEGMNLGNSLSGLAMYQNSKHRWTWGILGGQIPYMSGGYSQGVANVQGQPVLLDQEILFWQIDRQIAAAFSYPFSRAHRIEFTAGYQNMAFDAVAQTRLSDPLTGQLLARDTEDLPTYEGISAGIGSAALVYDTSIFGGTSPVMGQRYRFELGGSGGNLTWATALADYRRYFRIARPLTFALRGMHYGRYGGGANDPRLQQLFVGYPALIRGYDANSFSSAECGPDLGANGTCPVIDRLVGSRVAVGNAELRIPIFGFLGVIPSRSVPPVEIAPFFDMGVAWDRQQAVARRAVRSTGASLRVNLLGYTIAQISYVHPLDRPARSWYWEFSLIPGF